MFLKSLKFKVTYKRAVLSGIINSIMTLQPRIHRIYQNECQFKSCLPPDDPVSATDPCGHGKEC